MIKKIIFLIVTIVSINNMLQAMEIYMGGEKKTLPNLIEECKRNPEHTFLKTEVFLFFDGKLYERGNILNIDNEDMKHILNDNFTYFPWFKQKTIISQCYYKREDLSVIILGAKNISREYVCRAYDQGLVVKKIPSKY